MPIIRSAKKALRQSERRRLRNLKRKEVFKDAVKKIQKLVSAGKKDEALALLPQAYKALDKAAKRNVIHQNAASRKKSKLAKLIAKTAQS